MKKDFILVADFGDRVHDQEIGCSEDCSVGQLITAGHMAKPCTSWVGCSKETRAPQSPSSGCPCRSHPWQSHHRFSIAPASLEDIPALENSRPEEERENALQVRFTWPGGLREWTSKSCQRGIYGVRAAIVPPGTSSDHRQHRRGHDWSSFDWRSLSWTDLPTCIYLASAARLADIQYSASDIKTCSPKIAVMHVPLIDGNNWWNVHPFHHQTILCCYKLF